MSSTTIPTNFFDAAELVTITDANLDLDQVVFMSDSENSNSLPDIGLQEEVLNVGKETANEDLINFTIKQEEECIINDVGPDEGIEMARGALTSTMFGHEYEIKTLKMPSSDDINVGASTSFNNFCEIIPIEPPVGMCMPPSLSESFNANDEQFEIIRDDEKTDANTSLVDHPYSQPETSNKEFCDELVQDMLKETGFESNGSAVTLLAKFTEMCEHFFAVDESSQISIYLRSMKKTLVGYKVVEEQTKTFKEVPMTQESETEVTTQADDTLDSIELPESEPPVEEDKIEEHEVVVDSEVVVKLKTDLRLAQNIATKISDETAQLLNSSLVSEEEATSAKEKLVELLKNTRLELRNLQIDIFGIEVLKKKPQDSKNSDESSDESSDEGSENLKRKRMPKNGPQTPAIVSSTKEDSDDVSGAEDDVEDLELVSGDAEKTINIDKDIERLLNFETLHNKPAPSKTSRTKKHKKVVKATKTPGDVSDSYSSLSDNEDDSEESSNEDNSDSDSTDEEEKMLRRENDMVKQLLLVDSDVSQSSVDLSEDYGGLTSDDDKARSGTSKHTKIKEKKAKVNGAASQEKKIVDKSEDEKSDDNDVPSKAKKRVRRDSYEREIFHKNFLEIDGEKSSTSPKKQKMESDTKPTKSVESPSLNKNHEVDTSMYENRATSKNVDLDSLFEKRTMAFEGQNVAGPSTSAVQKPSKPSTPAAITLEEDGWISLSSDSDSELSAVTPGGNPGIPKRKKMLSEEELQKETKEAQKAEKQRIERLEKKMQTLTQIMSQRLSQDSGEVQPLILDFDKNKKTIEVHPKLVKFLKKHQVDGVKFLYDTCYGSISDKVSTESGCILAHCMGLGKTLQLITLIHTLIRHPQLKTKRVLVICPKSTIMNWNEEFNQWLRGIDSLDLKIYLLADQEKFEDRVRKLDEWYSSKRPGVFLINYEAFRNMVNYSGSRRLNSKVQLPASEVQRLQGIITRCFLSPGPDLVVCDEGHLIKNQANAINKAITQIETRRRIILTGTPVQNNLNEYYAMVDWIKPALLGTVKEFNNLYANPIKDGQCVDSTPQMIKKMKQRSLILNRNLSKFVQRKEATVLREFLPEKYEYCIFVPLTKVQEKLYRYFLDQNPAEGGKRLLNDYTALRKIWTHPKVLQNAFDRVMKGELKIDALAEMRKRRSNQVEDEEPDDMNDRVDGATGVKNNWWSRFVSDHDLESLFSSNKLLLLFHILRMCQERGEKVLVFSAFVAVLNVVEEFMRKINATNQAMKHNQPIHPNAQSNGYTDFLTSWREGQDYFRLDGSTKREARHQMVQRFNDTTNKQLRCFLISARAGGQGINLIGANRCIILDTAWNPSADQQNIFRIYRLGQRKTCFVYRLIAIGTMEEKVYSRSVTKQAMSGRVVDKMQIDRHYRMNELSELYTFTPCVLSNRPSPLMPTDEILKALLHQYPERAFSYHNHDSLLENKPEQDLSEEEIKEAWQLYEQESRGVPANRPMGGPQMPLLNDLTASMYNANLFAAASSLDSTAGLFQQLYPAAPQTSYPSPFDYLSTLMPFDMSAFRGPLATTSSKTVTPPSASSLLRNQLNTSNMPFSSNPFNFNPSTSITKTTNSPKRRTSAAKQLPPQLSTGSGSSSTSISSNLNNLVSLQQRIIHKNDKNPTTIPLDPEPTAARKSLPFPTKVNPVMTNKVRSNFNMPKPTTKGITSGKPLIPQRLAPNGSQVQRSRSNVSLQTPASNGVIQKSSSLQRVPNNQALQSSGAARTIQVANITKNNSTVIKPIARTSSSPMQQQVTKSPLTISHKTGSSNQSIEMAPVRLTSQKQFKPVVQQKTMPSLMPKIVMQPQHKVPQRTGPALPLPSKNPPLPRPQTLNSISVSKSVQMPQTINSSSVPKSIQMLTNSASPISITKLPLPGSSKVPLKPATTSGGSISLQRIPKIVSSQQQVMSGVQRTQIQSQKRPFENSQSLLSQSPQKRPRIGVPNRVKLLTRDQRDRASQDMPSEILDIVEIE